MTERLNQRDLPTDGENEDVSEIEIVPPANIELFLFSEGRASYLPEELRANPNVLAQARERRELYAVMKKVFQKMPIDDGDLSLAIENGHIMEEEGIFLYQRLSTFLAADPNHSRLILYLPFELLPNLRSKGTKSRRLEEAEKRFVTEYVQRWKDLLTDSDLRSSFVDGDIPEIELHPGKLPRVRKAAHLIPELVTKGYLNVDEVVTMMENTTDGELAASFADALPVLADKHLIKNQEWKRISTSVHAAVIEMKWRKLQTHIVNDDTKSIHFEIKPYNLYDCISTLKAKLDELEIQFGPTASKPHGMTDARMKWLHQVKRNHLVDQTAQTLAEAISAGDMTSNEVARLSTSEELHNVCPIVAVKSATFAVEQLALQDCAKARLLANTFVTMMTGLWEYGSSEVKDAIYCGLCHWIHLGIIEKNVAIRFGVDVPQLDALFPVSWMSIRSELYGLGDLIQAFAKDPKWSSIVYPVSLVFGSRLKGYSNFNADIDVAVFIRSAVSWKQRDTFIQELNQKMETLKHAGKVVEFWIGEYDGKLGLRLAPKDLLSVINIDWVHVLLGGAWVGQKAEVRRLYGDLLRDYIDLTRFGEQKGDIRSYLLGNIEQEVLQYRLMHKGYRRFYPSQRGEGTRHSDSIDWESDFWDPGYRRITSLLYISKVFLPTL